MFKNEDVVNQIRKRRESDNLVIGKIGATIKLKRKGKQQTLNNLSELFGVSISYLSKVENDLLKPNLDYLTDVLGDLEINESVLNDSLEMNQWYSMLIKHILKIEDYKKELIEFVVERNDFQSKMINFSLLVDENKFSNVPSLVRALLENINVMHKMEIYIFIMSLATYHIKVENYFAAGEIIKELDSYYSYGSLMNMWFLEIKYELALYQSSFAYFLDVYKELAYEYYLFNLKTKLEDIRERSLAALAYFLEPDNFLDYLEDEQMYRSYRLSHVYFERYQNFEQLERKNDLAQLLIDEINGNSKAVKKNWLKVEYKDDPLEQTLKEYFKYKYDFDKENMFLEETIFSGSGNSQHHYCSHFIVDYLTYKYSNEHKYKQCYLLNQRIKELDCKRKEYFNLQK